jgi:hypothetical protein
MFGFRKDEALIGMLVGYVALMFLIAVSCGVVQVVVYTIRYVGG